MDYRCRKTQKITTKKIKNIVKTQISWTNKIISYYQIIMYFYFHFYLY